MPSLPDISSLQADADFSTAVKGGEKVYRLAGAKVYHPLSEKGPRGALSVDLISRFFTLGKALDFVRYPQEMVFEPDEASFCFG